MPRQPGSRGSSTGLLLGGTLGPNFLSDCDYTQSVNTHHEKKSKDLGLTCGHRFRIVESDAHSFSSASKCGTAPASSVIMAAPSDASAGEGGGGSCAPDACKVVHGSVTTRGNSVWPASDEDVRVRTTHVPYNDRSLLCTAILTTHVPHRTQSNAQATMM